MSDERQASAIDRLVGAIGFTQMQVATTCAEGHDLTPPRPLLDALDEVRRYVAALEADRARLDWLERSGADVMHYDASEYPEHWTIDTGNLQEYDGEGFTLREAIDTAMSSSPLAPTQEGAT